MALKRVFVTYRLPEEILRPLNGICDLEVWTGTKPMTPSELFSAIFDRDGIICLLTDEITSSLLENQESFYHVCGIDHIDVTQRLTEIYLLEIRQEYLRRRRQI